MECFKKWLIENGKKGIIFIIRAAPVVAAVIIFTIYIL